MFLENFIQSVFCMHPLLSFGRNITRSLFDKIFTDILYETRKIGGCGAFPWKNDFQPFPEIIISVVNVFFSIANQVFKTCSKTYKNHFHENHFWVPSKSFSCVVNHFQTWSKWFFTEVNDFFSAKNSKKMIFVAVNHLLKIISKWKSCAKKSFPNGNHLQKKTKLWKRKSFTKQSLWTKNHLQEKVVVRSLMGSGSNKFDG